MKRNMSRGDKIELINLSLATVPLHKLNGVIIDKHLDLFCPGNSWTAHVRILALNSIIGQLSSTLFRKDISACALKVKHETIKGIIMWVAGDGACLLLHCLAGELKCARLADLGKGAGLVLTHQACWGAGALMWTGAVSPEWISQLHSHTLKRRKTLLKAWTSTFFPTVLLSAGPTRKKAIPTWWHRKLMHIYIAEEISVVPFTIKLKNLRLVWKVPEMDTITLFEGSCQTLDFLYYYHKPLEVTKSILPKWKKWMM